MEGAGTGIEGLIGRSCVGKPNCRPHTGQNPQSRNTCRYTQITGLARNQSHGAMTCI